MLRTDSPTRLADTARRGGGNEEKTPKPAKKPTGPNLEYRKSYAHLGSEYNIFRLLMKESNTKLNRVDLQRYWGIVKRGDYYGVKGKEGDGKTFGQVLYELQDPKKTGSYTYATKGELVSGLKKSQAFARLSEYMNDEWKKNKVSKEADIRSGVYQSEDVGSGTPGPPSSRLNDPEKKPKSAFEAMKDAMKDGDKDDAVSSSANARPGDFVAGKGYKTFDGGFVRGQARNAGGGRLDTVVRNDGKKGDYIAQGPRAVETATTTLRPKMPIAGGEDVRPDPGQSVVSDTTFETFSQLPEETTDHMQAPNSRLNQLNRQNETLRYMEHMAQPRQYNPANDPHGRPWQWSDEFSKPMFQQAFASEVKRHLDEQGASSRYMHREDMDDRLEEDYTSYGSSKRLRRPRPTPYSTVDMNIESMLPSRQEVGVLMNRRRFRDQDRSTWRSVL